MHYKCNNIAFDYCKKADRSLPGYFIHQNFILQMCLVKSHSFFVILHTLVR
ncbi:hypothetical protein RG47T_2800 [Mucilaginibacter polytrichastri]|uniref:Uncharacterized protein n=1 Tax=Mucilaginibacter polytrichastri TaxID=1302689 RepID=A0A1Q5ZZZ8_9SPHI|nr:hypothetical protein RG47T_2800 [Mucilaginibacter polytrichastri]